MYRTRTQDFKVLKSFSHRICMGLMIFGLKVNTSVSADRNTTCGFWNRGSGNVLRHAPGTSDGDASAVMHLHMTVIARLLLLWRTPLTKNRAAISDFMSNALLGPSKDLDTPPKL